MITPPFIFRTRLALIAFTIVATYGFWMKAWITEDAFINFRVIENALSGNGLVWNLGERVQVFTSPLWILLSISIAALTKEVIFSTLAMSYGLTALTFGLLFLVARRNVYVFLPCAALLMLAPSFRDFTSSGLETPLLSATLAFLCQMNLRTPGSFRWLVFAASLCVATRHDALLLVLPFVIRAGYLLHEKPLSSKLTDIAVGSFPVLIWTVFSLIYFGSPLPNTAFAKITGSIEALDLTQQTMHYFAYMLGYDPITIAIILGTITICFAAGSKARWPLAFALTLFGAYLFQIGGDYMAGRFFIGPVILSVFSLADAATQKTIVSSPVLKRPPWLARLSTVALILPTLILAINYRSSGSGLDHPPPAIVHGIVDERAFYHGSTDFLTLLTTGADHPFRTVGETLRRSKQEGEIAVSCYIGMIGYFSGPETRIVDAFGLGDAFLARLPPRPGTLRIGHFERLVPRDYLASLLASKNLFSNPAAARYFDDIFTATRDPLWSAHRMAAIWRLNTGHHSAFLRNTDVSTLGGAVVYDGDSARRSASCMGGDEAVAYLVGPQEISHHRPRPIIVDDL